MKHLSTTLAILFITFLSINAFSQDRKVVTSNQGVLVNPGKVNAKNLNIIGRDQVARDLLQQLKDAGKTLAQAVCDIRNNSVITAANVLANSAVVFGSSEATVIIKMKTCWTGEEMAKGLSDAYGYTVIQVAAKLKAAGYTAAAVRAALQTGLKQTFEIAIGALAGGGYTVNEIATVINNIGIYSANEIGGFLKSHGFDANKITDAFKNTLNLGGKAAAAVLQDLNFNAIAIGNALKANYRATFSTIAGWLKAANMGSNPIIEFGVLAFNISANTGASVLKNLGYTTNQIAKALNDGMNANVQTITGALNKAGFGPDATVAALKSINANATGVANSLKSVYNKNANDVAALMNKAGYATSLIISGLADAFGIARNVIDGILGALAIH